MHFAKLLISRLQFFVRPGAEVAPSLLEDAALERDDGAIIDGRCAGRLPGSRTGAAASKRHLEKMIADLNPFVRGWAGYFGFSQWRELPWLDGRIRRRLRCVVWFQW